MPTRRLGLSLSTVALLAAAAASAQTPTVVQPDQRVEGKLTTTDAAMPDGSPHVCYAVNTKPGDQIALTLHADKFPARLSVGRGPSCATAALQFDKTATDGKDAHLGFKAAGGRYVIAVRGAKPEDTGAFRLNVQADLAIAGEPAPVAAPPAAANGAEPSARKQAMMAQVGARRAEIAAEQERQRLAAERARVEAERQAALMEQLAAEEAAQRAEEEAEEAARPRINLAERFANSFNEAMAQKNAEYARQQQFLDGLAAQQRAAVARQQAEQTRQDAARREAQRAQAENQQALARQLADANAYRNSQMAGADAATRQRLAQQNQAAQQAAQQVGGGQAFQQRQAELSAQASAQRAAEAQAQERQRRLDQQRAIDQQRAAEQQRLADAQRRQQLAQSSPTRPPSSSSSSSGLVIADRPASPPPAPVTASPPRQTPIPTQSSSSLSLSCPAAQRRSYPEELMVEFKYGKTRAEAEAELSKKQSGVYDVQCSGNDFGWQCKAKYKTGVIKEFCVGGPSQ